MPITSNRCVFDRQTIIATAPNLMGVYGLYDSYTEKAIYYGKAEGTYSKIKDRLLAHLSGNEGRCTKRAQYFNYESTLTSSARERELLHEHTLLHGGLPRCNNVMP